MTHFNYRKMTKLAYGNNLTYQLGDLQTADY